MLTMALTVGISFIIPLASLPRSSFFSELALLFAMLPVYCCRPNYSRPRPSNGVALGSRVAHLVVSSSLLLASL